MNIPMELCEFNYIGMETYSCVKCGITVSSADGPPALVCASLDIINSLATTQSEDICNSTEVESRYNICKSCDFFQNSACLKCGCRIVRNIEFQNKLFWKHESCPINKW